MCVCVSAQEKSRERERQRDRGRDRDSRERRLGFLTFGRLGFEAKFEGASVGFSVRRGFRVG